MKRLIAAALVLLFLVCFTSALASSPGSQSDPLVSLEYIVNTYAPALIGDCKALVNNAVGALYGKATGDIEQAYNDAMLRLGGLEGYEFAGSFTAVGLPVGKTAELVTGSTFILAAGSATLQVTRGAVVNISTGAEAAAGSSLAVNQRYFCAEDTSAVFTSVSDAVCLLDGYYKSTGSLIADPDRFTDVHISDWFFTAVNYAGEHNLFNGTTPTTFSPQSPMTRGMFVTVLHRLAGKPPVSAESVFPDVGAPSEYYYDAVLWANTNKLVTGYDDGSFHPGDLITREQMAVIMHRYAAYAGFGTAADSTAAFDKFPDKDSVSGYAADAMRWAVSEKLVSGSDGSLLPKNTATRAQVAQIILNFCRNIAGM